MSMDKKREELLLTLTQRMMSVMRHVRHPVPPPETALSPPQVHLLFSIARSKDEGISVKELAEYSHVTPGAVTQFVDGLVEKGLVAREGDPNDRRVVRLKLTELAKSQFDKFRKEHWAYMFKIFEALNDDEIKQLIELFTKMDNYHEMKAKTIDKTD